MDPAERARLYLKDSPTKRKLLKLVAEQPLSLVELADRLEISSPSVHQHVGELVQLGLVEKERVGRRTYVSPSALAKQVVQESP